MRQESAGWPDECTTREEKAAYIQAYKDKEGIQL